jgi:hypothetical protein
MKQLFPTTVVDHFLEDPDKIRNLALNMEYIDSDGRYPGKRTKPVHQINKELHDYLCNKFFSVFYDFLHPVNWNIELTFQLIDSFDESESSAFNKGWIHLDNDRVIGGVLYLTPDANLESGTSIYLPKPTLSEEEFNEVYNDPQEPRFALYKDGIKHTEYQKHLNKFNSNFIETVNVKNVYNRLIAFDANSWHAAQNFHGTAPRLTLNIFVNSINSISHPPLDRITYYKF